MIREDLKDQLLLLLALDTAKVGGRYGMENVPCPIFVVGYHFYVGSEGLAISVELANYPDVIFSIPIEIWTENNLDFSNFNMIDLLGEIVEAQKKVDFIGMYYHYQDNRHLQPYKMFGAEIKYPEGEISYAYQEMFGSEIIWNMTVEDWFTAPEGVANQFVLIQI